MDGITVFNVVLGIIASFFAIGATTVLVLRYLYQRNQIDGRPEPPLWRLIAQAGVVFAGVLIVALIISNLASASNRTTPAPTATFASGGNGPSNTDAGIPTATNIAGVDPTETPVDVPTTSGNATTYDTQTITPNWQLECGGCNEPILATISKIAVDAGNQNMVWTFTLKDHTADNVSRAYFETLYLMDQADPNNNRLLSTGPARSNNPGASMTAGNSTQIQATFSFLPKHGGIYTLTADLASYINGPDYYTDSYYQQTITFP